MFQINRSVTRKVVDNYFLAVDEGVMHELNYFLKTEYNIAPITEDEAAAFMAMYCHYDEHNCAAEFLGTKHTTRALELCEFEGWTGEKYSIYLYHAVGEFLNTYVWDSFDETVDTDSEEWHDDLYRI